MTEMGPIIAVIVIGVLYPVSFVVFIISFTRLRSDMHAGFDRIDAGFDRLDAGFDRLDEKFDARFDRLEARFDRLEARFDRLDATVDGLDMTLARKHQLTGPEERKSRKAEHNSPTPCE